MRIIRHTARTLVDTVTRKVPAEVDGIGSIPVSAARVQTDAAVAKAVESTRRGLAERGLAERPAAMANSSGDWSPASMRLDHVESRLQTWASSSSSLNNSPQAARHARSPKQALPRLPRVPDGLCTDVGYAVNDQKASRELQPAAQTTSPISRRSGSPQQSVPNGGLPKLPHHVPNHKRPPKAASPQSVLSDGH